MLTARDIRIAAYFLGTDVERRRADGQPVPAALKETLAELLAVAGQLPSRDGTDSETLVSTTEIAARTGKSERTIRRWCAARNTPKIGNRYLIKEIPQ
jgi:hypothetical protein